MSSSGEPRCEHIESVSLYVVHGLPEHDAAQMHAHIGTCSACREELAALGSVVATFSWWPTDVLRPSGAVWDALADRIAKESGREPVRPSTRQWSEPEWEEVGPGLFCKLLAADADRVSMLVRLAPGAEYPPHRHAGIEELHLLDGELWIDDRKLCPGDYNRAEPGTADERVWSETGCTCVLITSPHDVLG
jgi:anti-sigma factor ChrR (cupin superfamily)